MFRSFLFVPGDRPERFGKAAASGADAVCIDLEDAVAPAQKPPARKAALEALARPRGESPAIGLRLNSFETIDGWRDVVALAESPARPAFILLPKVRAADAILRLRAALGGPAPICAPIFALIETPEALAQVGAIAAAVGDAGGLIFGGADLSAALGCEVGFEPLYYARAALVAGAAASGCQMLDVPYLDVRDTQGLVAETRRVKAMGFTGRSAIHPDQIGPINAIFTPTADEIAKAQAIIAAYEANAGRVLLVDGRLVEKPILAAARRTLARIRT